MMNTCESAVESSPSGNPSAYQVLIVEDELRLLHHLAHVMQEVGFAPTTASSYREVEILAHSPPNRFDIIILDRLLHGRDSAELVPTIKALFIESKILILSAINSPAEKASLLDQGADDYLAKPFDSEELIARVRVLSRRIEPILKFGNVTLNSNRRTMKVADQEYSLPNKEFILLRTLIQTPGKIFSKITLLKKVWEMSTEIESNSVEATVNKVRRRLQEARATIQIKNTRNTGYWIEE